MMTPKALKLIPAEWLEEGKRINLDKYIKQQIDLKMVGRPEHRLCAMGVLACGPEKSSYTNLKEFTSIKIYTAGRDIALDSSGEIVFVSQGLVYEMVFTISVDGITASNNVFNAGLLRLPRHPQASKIVRFIGRNDSAGINFYMPNQSVKEIALAKLTNQPVIKW